MDHRVDESLGLLAQSTHASRKKTCLIIEDFLCATSETREIYPENTPPEGPALVPRAWPLICLWCLCSGCSAVNAAVVCKFTIPPSLADLHKGKEKGKILEDVLNGQWPHSDLISLNWKYLTTLPSLPPPLPPPPPSSDIFLYRIPVRL